MEKYKDIENPDKIISEIKELGLNGDYKSIFNKINDIYPDWICSTHDKYSNDYRFLDTNWNTFCSVLKTTKKKIILVEFIIFEDPKYSILSTISEILTRLGYVIRRKEEFTVCSFCSSVIPTEKIHSVMVQRNLDVPTNWLTDCTNCIVEIL